MPKRIQRKRTKGWKMPEGAMCVTRPGRFGNPFTVDMFGIDLSLKLFANSVHGIWDPYILRHQDDIQFLWAYAAHKRFMQRLGNHPTENIRYYLRGKDLACWCAEGQPCHVEILLEIANS